MRGGNSVPLLHTHGAGRLHTVTADAPSSEPLLSNNQREALPQEGNQVRARHVISIRENKIPQILTKNIGWIMPPQMNFDAYFFGLY